jgi:hypothetical protein
MDKVQDKRPIEIGMSSYLYRASFLKASRFQVVHKKYNSSAALPKNKSV